MSKYNYHDIEEQRHAGVEWSVIGQSYGATAKQVRQAYWYWRKRQDTPETIHNQKGTPSGDKVDGEWKPGTGSLSGQGREPLSLEQLMELSHLDPEAWEVDWVRPGYSEVGTKHPESGEVTVTKLFNLKAKLSPTLSTSVLEEVKGEILEEMRSRSQLVSRPYAVENPPKDPKMAEMILMDIHLGMLSWRYETGVDYDLHIADQAVRACVSGVLDEGAGQAIGEFVVPVGNDFFHTDITIKGKGGTTAQGTPQDVDGRWQKAFNMGRHLMTWTIDRLLEIAPVRLVVVPGNHDKTKSWYLGEVLAAWYHADPNVTVDNRPSPRKYLRHGNTLLGYCHGDGEKPADLPNIMAHEARDHWGHTRFQEWHMGHWHHDWVKEHKGVTLRYLPAITPSDAWHTEQGYVGNHREAQMMLWSLDRGRTATFHHTLVPTPEQEMALGEDWKYVGTPYL